MPRLPLSCPSPPPFAPISTISTSPLSRRRCLAPHRLLCRPHSSRCSRKKTTSRILPASKRLSTSHPLLLFLSLHPLHPPLKPPSPLLLLTLFPLQSAPLLQPLCDHLLLPREPAPLAHLHQCPLLQLLLQRLPTTLHPIKKRTFHNGSLLNIGHITTTPSMTMIMTLMPTKITANMLMKRSNLLFRSRMVVVLMTPCLWVCRQTTQIFLLHCPPPNPAPQFHFPSPFPARSGALRGSSLLHQRHLRGRRHFKSLKRRHQTP